MRLAIAVGWAPVSRHLWTPRGRLTDGLPIYAGVPRHRSFHVVMRRAAGGALRKVAFGGWVVVALLAVPVTPTALAADGTGDGATDGLSRSYEHHAHGPHAYAGDPRGEGHPARGDWGHWTGGGHRGDAQPTAPVVTPASDPAAAAPTTPANYPPAATPVPEKDPVAPRIEIGTALGPVSGVQGPASATSAASAAQSGRTTAIPLLSFDAPSAFAPRSLAGRLRGAADARTVQVAIRRGGRRPRLRLVDGSRRTLHAARRAGCAAPRWMPTTLRRVAGGWRWRASLGATLAPGQLPLPRAGAGRAPAGRSRSAAPKALGDRRTRARGFAASTIALTRARGLRCSA